MQISAETRRFLRAQSLAPTLHFIIFAVTWLADLAQSQPLLDGPARWGFGILFVADFPISLVAFSWMWDGRTVQALFFWGLLGTAWWYLLGICIDEIREWFRRRTSRDV